MVNCCTEKPLTHIELDSICLRNHILWVCSAFNSDGLPINLLFPRDTELVKPNLLAQKTSRQVSKNGAAPGSKNRAKV